MIRTLGYGLFTAALLLVFRAPLTAADNEAVRTDETLLREAGLSPDGRGLLNFFRCRSRGEADTEQVEALLKKLAAKDAGVRDAARGELVALGPPAIPWLRQVARDTDAPESAAQARMCLQTLEENSAALTRAAVRLIAAQQPEGTVTALLTFLPYAEEESVLDEVRTALTRVAATNSGARTTLVRALGDQLPLRRATALMALCPDGMVLTSPGQGSLRDTLRKLLQDPMPSVRLRAALVLGRSWDATAVQTLIALLDELPLEQGREAEEFLSTLAAEQAPRVALQDTEASRRACRDAWSAWWQSSADGKPLEEFRKRTLTENQRQKMEALIQKLGDDSFAVREQATAELKTLGATVLPLLRQAAQSPDLEVRRRAQSCLAVIETDRDTPLSPVLARLVALRKPPEAVSVLLAFLPTTDDATLIQEIQAALNVLAYREEKPDPVLLRALEDSFACRRAAAAEALCQGDISAIRPALLRLLRDPDPSVRLKTALALAGAREREAIPVLIALLGELPAEQATLVEDYLQRLALNHPPADLPKGEGEARQKRGAAWTAWWKAYGDQISLVDPRPSLLQQRYHGYTLLIQQNGEIVELGTEGKPRWQINGLLGPQDARVLPNGHVLIAEFNGQRVTERDHKGTVLWQKQLNSWPIGAERLSNGHTFIVCRNLLTEVDRSGREIFSISRPHDVLTARKLRDGQIVCITNQRSCVRLDRTGKELKRFPIQTATMLGNDVLANGHVLVPIMWMNKVQEYDNDGKVVWEASINQPLSAARLPNGNTLVVLQQWPPRIVEIDRAGKQIAEQTASNWLVRARKR